MHVWLIKKTRIYAKAGSFSISHYIKKKWIWRHATCFKDFLYVCSVDNSKWLVVFSEKLCMYVFYPHLKRLERLSCSDSKLSGSHGPHHIMINSWLKHNFSIMAIQGIFEGVHHVARKVVPIIHNPVCEEALVGSGVSLLFNTFKSIRSGGTLRKC